MSQKYEWLYNTTYPDKVQEFTEKLNITPNDATLIKQIQALIEQKKFAEANELRKQIPNYKQKEIIAQDWNTMADTVVALQLEYDSRYTPSYVLSKEKPTNQSEGDYWYRITNIKYFGETEEIGIGEKSPDNPYILQGLEVPDTEITLYSLPSGVCDEYNTQASVLIKKVNKVTLNGTQTITWVSNLSDNDWVTFTIAPAQIGIRTRTNIFCDKMPVTLQNTNRVEIDSSGKIVLVQIPNIWIGISKSDTTTIAKEKINVWLSQNPITVLYELETPEIIQL